MKLSTYHKLKGDEVFYVYGKQKWAQLEYWDHVYVSSMFTYDIDAVADTVRFYSENLFNFDKIKVGGIAATLMPDYILDRTGILPHRGALTEREIAITEGSPKEGSLTYLQNTLPCIDNLPPDYEFGGEDSSRYGQLLSEAYILTTTKGCPNKCAFCAVDSLEPEYVDYIPIVPRVDYLASHFGERVGLVLLDNNVAASKWFFRIIDEIRDLGFGKGARLGQRARWVDFNQGTDARLLDRAKLQKLSSICIKPLRIAFDSWNQRSEYEKAVRTAAEFGITSLSNYLLYNYNDRPESLWRRLELSLSINEELGTKIYAFPMKFMPLDARSRKNNVGRHWTQRQLRAMQLVLNATHGLVSSNPEFARRALGSTEQEFLEILILPEHYIFYRDYHERQRNDIQEWRAAYRALSTHEKAELFSILRKGRLERVPLVGNSMLDRVLRHYEGELAEYRYEETKPGIGQPGQDRVTAGTSSWREES